MKRQDALGDKRSRQQVFVNVTKLQHSKVCSIVSLLKSKSHHCYLNPSDAAGVFPRGDGSTIHVRSAGSLPDPGVEVLPGRNVPGGRGGGEELASGICVQAGAGLINIAIGEVVRCVLLFKLISGSSPRIIL